MAKNGWKTLAGADIENVQREIRNEYEKSIERDGHIFAYVGTDGQNIGTKATSFVQCVALHIFDDTGIGKGGRVYYIRHMEDPYKSMQQKLLREVELSINLAQKMEPLFDELGIPFEVHLDVNSDPGKYGQNKSNVVHDASQGWGESYGFTVKTKPDAFVASIVADYHVRGVRKIKPMRKKVKK